MVSPIPPIIFSIAFGLLVALCTGAAVSLGVYEVPPCDSFTDFLTGCSSTFSAVMAFGVLGTIPGAAIEVNLIMGLIGLTNRFILLWSLLRWARGGG